MIRGYAAVGIVNTKTDHNVGGALRAAHCYRAAMVAIQGARYKHQSADTTKMSRHIPLIETSDLWNVMPYNCEPIAVEFIDSAIKLPRFCHPERGMYIFGPEDGSLPGSILLRCKYVVSIPTAYCMNLAASVNVVLYDRLVKRMSDENDSLEVLELEANKVIDATELPLHQ